MAVAHVERRQEVDEATAEDLAELILTEAQKRLDSGYPIRARWDAEVVALVVTDDELREAYKERDPHFDDRPARLL